MAFSIEHENQKVFFFWARNQVCIYPELEWIFAIPNGGRRGGTKQQAQRAGRKLKMEGVKSGILDIMLPVAKGGYHGLFIEMKCYDKNGKKTYPFKEQRQFIEFLKQQGYCVFVCYTSSDAIDVTKAYLEEKIETITS